VPGTGTWRCAGPSRRSRPRSRPRLPRPSGPP